MRVRSLYLLGPMSGYPAMNHPAFHQWAKTLRAEGFKVVNPAELDEEMGQEDKVELLYARDLPFLAQCDGGAAMPGWRSSKGATWEAGLLGVLMKRPVFELPNFHLLTEDKLPKLVLPQ